jgi:hypothetical protein
MRNKGLIVAALAVLLLALGGGIALAAWPLVEQIQRGEMRWSGLPFRGEAAVAEETIEQRFTVFESAELVVENQRGGIVVTGGSDEGIVIAARKRAWAATQSQAEADLALVKVSFTQTDSAVRVVVEQPFDEIEPGEHGPNEVSFTITVPARTKITASTRSGELSVSNVEGDTIMKTRFGTIEAQELNGSLDAESGSGSISARGVRAEGSDVILTTRFGTIDYRAGSAGSLRADTGSGAVTLTNLAVQGSAVVASRFGKISLAGVAASEYDLSTQSGAVRVENVTGSLKARSGFGNIAVVEAHSVDLDLETRSGSVEFSGALGSGPHTITTGYGSVRVAVPSEQGFNFDITTNFGQFRPEIPVTLASASERSRSQWVGSVNGGGPSLVISTRSGNIELEALDR